MSVFSPKNGLDERWAKAVDDDWLLEKFKFYLLFQNFDWFFDWLNIAFQDFCKRKMFSKLACDIHEIGTQNLDFFYNCHMITSTPCEVFEGEKTFCEWRVTLKKRSKIRLLFTALPQIYFTTIKGHNFLFAVTHSHFNFTFNHKIDIF